MTDHYREAWDELTAPGGSFEIETIDVRGVPIQVFKSAPPNMRAVWEMSAAHGDKDYIVYEDERHTFTEVHAQVRSLAHVLRVFFSNLYALIDLGWVWPNVGFSIASGVAYATSFPFCATLLLFVLFVHLRRFVVF